MKAVLGSSLLVIAAGHGYMNEPPSRGGATIEGGGSCPYGTCNWFNQGCTIGCPKCGGSDGSATCSQQGKATLPKEARTYFLDSEDCGVNPWCAPGSAPVFNPCGIAGGDVNRGKPGNGGEAPYPYKLGDHGDEMPELTRVKKRVWEAGGIAEVAWAIIANHGGGYQYRLCPKNATLTEECFQKMPLEFIKDEHEIQFCPLPWAHNMPANMTPNANPPSEFFPPCDMRERLAIPAVKVSEGVVPEGSTWMRNPIPGCKPHWPYGPSGGAFDVKCGPGYGSQPGDYQFPPAIPDQMRPGFLLGGFGYGACGGCAEPGNSPVFCGKMGQDGPRQCSVTELLEHMFQFSVVDAVRVPKVPPGEYVVSFRWDSEQTPQVWNQCADITITDSKEDIMV